MIMITAIFIYLSLVLYPALREGFIRLMKDILLGITYIIAGIIRGTRIIINLFRKIL